MARSYFFQDQHLLGANLTEYQIERWLGSWHGKVRRGGASEILFRFPFPSLQVGNGTAHARHEIAWSVDLLVTTPIKYQPNSIIPMSLLP